VGNYEKDFALARRSVALRQVRFGGRAAEGYPHRPTADIKAFLFAVLNRYQGTALFFFIKKQGGLVLLLNSFLPVRGDRSKTADGGPTGENKVF
jgi:hypothetical protein